MIHMLSSFDLKPGEDFAIFQSDYTDFVADLRAAGIIEGAGPLGARVSDTPMDTDDERDHEYFAVMSFRDRTQVDAAYARDNAAHWRENRLGRPDDKLACRVVEVSLHELKQKTQHYDENGDAEYRLH